jgi:N-acetylglutamate synthase-like GNAT family acetyltransferase
MTSNLHVRRATTDDLENLKSLWTSMRLPADELEKRLTEFQVVEAEGQIAGAIGIHFSRQYALLHSEGYVDFSIADAARELFWERIQTLAAHHGVFRIWTRERSPFWTHWGFQPASAETFARLPAEWRTDPDNAWLTFKLKNEEIITAALEKQFAGFMDSEREQTARVSEKARALKTAITVIGFAIGILCFGAAIYLLIHRNPFSQ